MTTSHSFCKPGRVGRMSAVFSTREVQARQGENASTQVTFDIFDERRRLVRCDFLGLVRVTEAAQT